MTLIVGIRCTDGIVLAADGAATLGSLGQQTAQQRTVKKLTILPGSLVVGVSGPVGLSQRFQAALDQGFQANRYSARAEVAMGVMRTDLWQILGPEWTAAHTVANVIGPQAAMSSALCSALVAVPLNGRPELVEFDQQCAPTLATNDLPFMAVGSGQSIADPFLAFIRKVFWPQGCPTVRDGIFSAAWAVEHAIHTSPGGVAPPLQVVVLEPNAGGGWQARELPDPDLRDHHHAIEDAEHTLKGWRDALTGAPGVPPAQRPPA